MPDERFHSPRIDGRITIKTENTDLPVRDQMQILR
jgi:hypothetical protein